MELMYRDLIQRNSDPLPAYPFPPPSPLPTPPLGHITLGSRYFQEGPRRPQEEARRIEHGTGSCKDAIRRMEVAAKTPRRRETSSGGLGGMLQGVKRI